MQREVQIRRLRWPLHPYDDESLRGFVGRSASHNRVRASSILGEARIGDHYKFIRGDLTTDQQRILSEVLSITVNQTSEMLYRRTAGRSSMITFQARAFGIARQLKTGRRISPASLEVRPYDRAIWEVKDLPFCPASMDILTSRCSKCERDLRWNSRTDIVFCDFCGQDLRQIAVAKVPEIDHHLARISSALISHKSADQEWAVSHLSMRLRHLVPYELFQLGILLGERLSSSRTYSTASKRKWSRRRIDTVSRPDAISLDVYLFGFETLFNWPTGIDELICSESASGLDAMGCSTAARLRQLVSYPSMTNELREELLTVLPPIELVPKTTNLSAANKNRSLFNDEYTAQRRARGLLNYKETAERLGIRIPSVRKAILAGLMPPTVEGVRGRLFKASDIDRIQSRIADRIPQQHVRISFGLSTLACEQLDAVEAIDNLRDTICYIMQGGPFARKSEIHDLMLKITSLAKPADNPRSLITILEAMRNISCRDKPWKPLIDAILTYEIPIYRPASEAISFGDFRVPLNSLPLINSFEFNFAEYPKFVRRRAISGPEWEEYLNLEKPAKAAIIRRGLLPIDLSTSRHLCSISAVQEFARNFISIWELRARAELSHITLKRFRSLLRTMMPESVQGEWFWHRETINQDVLPIFWGTR